MKKVKTCSFYWCQKIIVLCVQAMLLLGVSAVFAQHKAIVKKVFKVPQRACVLEPVISDARIEKMKKEARNEDDFYDAADDVNYYLYQAEEFMKRHGQKAILVPAAYTDILFPNGEIIQADTIAFGSMILYKPGKNPQVVSSVDIAEAYKSYFNPVKRKRRR
ncbi:hypothetical protein CJ231_09955 [Hoylesella buccalis]|uniref:Uncharacterized protein n=1 Tax=Hoylesella buccalis TaxID=28127 RepID=A0A2N6QNX4_9BACT|nr:hypothetical protein [Hoylesella buccalis]PMC23282.1 hypothetical protein CJ231_09955 [Hoylesella buccalis]